MPNIPTLIQGINGGGGGGILDQILGAVPGILGAFGFGENGSGGGPTVAQPIALPGGAAIQPVRGMFPLLGGGNGATCITPRQGVTMRLPSRVDVPVVDAAGNMRFTTFKNVGRPVLWTGDIAIAKRVKKVAGRARRASGGR